MKNQKRKLKLSIKQDVETKEYEIQIIEQTHRNNEFSPTGSGGRISFTANRFGLCSEIRPEIFSEPRCFDFYVRGYNREEDNRICKTKDKEYVENLIAAVEAYNNYVEVKRPEKIKKPEWCNFTGGCCISENSTYEYCSGKEFSDAPCEHLKAVKEPQHITRVKENLRDYLTEKIDDLLKIKRNLDGLNTEQEITEWKRKLMHELIELPITTEFCSYCLKNNQDASGLDVNKCEQCEYGKVNGMCFEADSVYRKISDKLLSLKRSLWDYTIK